MNIGLVQLNPAWEDKQKNMKRISELLYNVEPGSADIVIFPELTLTGFTMRSRSFAETGDGPSYEFFAQMARSKNCQVLYGHIAVLEDKYYNAMTHLNSDGTVASIYRKIHPFSFTGEERFYAAGDKPVITRIKNESMGLSICYDLRFPELFRKYGQGRAGIIINIANWPIPRIHHWTALLQARAIENLCYVVGVNRTGNDKSNQYNGASRVIDPYGTIVRQLSDTESCEIVAIDLETVRTARSEFPFLNDIRLL